MTAPTIAKVEALRDLLVKWQTYAVGFRPDIGVALCDFWLAAHQSTPATPPQPDSASGANVDPTTDGPSGAGGSAGALSAEDVWTGSAPHLLKCADAHDHGYLDTVHLSDLLRKAAARIEALARERDEWKEKATHWNDPLGAASLSAHEAKTWKEYAETWEVKAKMAESRLAQYEELSERLERQLAAAGMELAEVEARMQERCAKVCDEKAARYSSHSQHGPMSAKRVAAETCATAIRALGETK